MSQRVMPQSLAAVRVAPSTTELQYFDIPQVREDDALMQVLVAGICGTDVKVYREEGAVAPVIMGHENVGVITAAGRIFVERKGVDVGDLVFVEHYLPDFTCEWCHTGEYRHCQATDWRSNPRAQRYGYTTSLNPPHLWGGFSEYMYLPWNAVVHSVPQGLAPELAGLATPLSNGIEWSLNDGGVQVGNSVLIQGPGQQGLSQVVACRQAGAGIVIVTGTKSDRRRLEVARLLGADLTIDTSVEDALPAILEITGGRGVDIALDCTSGASRQPLLLALDALKRRGGRIVVQGNMATFDDFPLSKLATKAVVLIGARGHSFQSCEVALGLLAAKRFAFDLLATHTFTLDRVEEAIDAVAGSGPEGVIHASILPWSSSTASYWGHRSK